jgi:hypothetical protein
MPARAANEAAQKRTAEPNDEAGDAEWGRGSKHTLVAACVIRAASPVRRPKSFAQRGALRVSASHDVIASPFPPGLSASMFDAAHGLPSVTAELASRGCYGVSRYRTGSGDYPALSFTVSWGRSGAWVERVSAFVSLGPIPSHLEPASAWSAWVPLHLMPEPLRGWPVAVSSFAAAPSVNRLAGLDGFSCLHSWVSPEGSGEVEWVWPNGRDRSQWRLIGAYRQLQPVAWLCSWRGMPAHLGVRRKRVL